MQPSGRPPQGDGPICFRPHREQLRIPHRSENCRFRAGWRTGRNGAGRDGNTAAGGAGSWWNIPCRVEMELLPDGAGAGCAGYGGGVLPGGGVERADGEGGIGTGGVVGGLCAGGVGRRHLRPARLCGIGRGGARRCVQRNGQGQAWPGETGETEAESGKVTES